MESKRVIHVGLLGLGTVGTGVVKALQENREHIYSQNHFEIQMKRILVRDLNKQRNVFVESDVLTNSGDLIVNDPEISVVIEVMGGIDTAYSLLKQALLSGKHAVTANKELLAKKGQELLQIAASSNVHLLYEASVGGGIPVIRTLQGYLHANRVDSLRGILNGTCNYILTQMTVRQMTFQEALAQAQSLGYAEADPTSDVEGYDAAYKLSILANMSFPVSAIPTEVDRQGITAVDSIDIKMARSLQCSIKLIAEGVYDGHSVQLSVRPRMIPFTDSLSGIQDEFNAVVIHADVVGDLMLVGKGAGERPTASAVIEDLMVILQSAMPTQRKNVDPWTPRQVNDGWVGSVKWTYFRIILTTQTHLDSVKMELNKWCSDWNIEQKPVIFSDLDQTRNYIVALLPLSLEEVSQRAEKSQWVEWLAMNYEGDISVLENRIIEMDN